MPTAIVLPDETDVHVAHPDENDTTFCGLSWSHKTAERIVSRANSADYTVKTLANEEDMGICTDCLKNGEEWATPDDVQE